ncbi:MAG: DASS family sodium-coupled anion symporter [Pirellulaceae bacterium]
MNEVSKVKWNSPANVGRWLGPLVAILFWIGPRLGWLLSDGQPELNLIAGVAAWIAIWWLTEAIPLAATALLPLALFPLLGLQSAKSVAVHYGNSFIFLFLGGFLVALAIEETGLHRRLALSIVALLGDSPQRLVLGFMVATAALSMWISNSATTLLMLPIAASVLSQADLRVEDPQRRANLGVALMLGIAYAASIGGVATLIGTPPNIAFSGFYHETYTELPPISFLGWMLMALPFSAVFLGICWLVLIYGLFPIGRNVSLGGNQIIREELAKLGSMRAAEWRVAGVFLATAVLWITREPLEGYGWGAWFIDSSGDSLVDDSTVAMLMAVLCFAIPRGGQETGPLLVWKSTARLPWGVLLLFGGGVALANGVQTTGLDKYLGAATAAALGGSSELGMTAITATTMIWLTEFTSNLASVQMMNPVLGSAAQELGVSPLTLLLPSTLAASCAFMMPVATPPNAIVYSSGRVPIQQMIKAGIVLNLISSVLVTLTVYLLGHLLE